MMPQHTDLFIQPHICCSRTAQPSTRLCTSPDTSFKESSVTTCLATKNPKPPEFSAIYELSCGALEDRDHTVFCTIRKFAGAAARTSSPWPLLSSLPESGAPQSRGASPQPSPAVPRVRAGGPGRAQPLRPARPGFRETGRTCPSLPGGEGRAVCRAAHGGHTDFPLPGVRRALTHTPPSAHAGAAACRRLERRGGEGNRRVCPRFSLSPPARRPPPFGGVTASSPLARVCASPGEDRSHRPGWTEPT